MKKSVSYPILSSMFSLVFLHQDESVSLDVRRLELIASEVSSRVDIPQHGIIHIAYISDDAMRTLNHTYRQKDSTTDVLSFHYFEDFASLGDDEVAGEVVLSLSRVTEQAGEHGHSIERELEILVLHGVLHILGFDHETDEDYMEMWSYESVIRQNLLLTN